ncbi:hypothetical protein B0I35DRAFT_443869 [Stachybotrys elegans]|uniref:Uncharacterized protein n=1 Tax=Stachybotrys elegans TaxID=80388 RepID=A0A8K0SBB1_9HYPO|nr:hypothetical protein B0I35DRAFT_443869 [Stachybotrys elegans]
MLCSISCPHAIEAKHVPDLLFHTTLTVVDYQGDVSGSTRYMVVLGTNSNLKDAKSFCLCSLQRLGFDQDEFSEYKVRPTEDSVIENWEHGERVIIFAKAPSEQVFLVGIFTTPNTESLPANQAETLILPDGATFLHYVLKTTVDYNADRTGSKQWTEILGSFVHRADAWTAAHKTLNKTDFAEYNERGDQELVGQWPYDDDVAVHAVTETGLNLFISIKVPPIHDIRGRMATRKLSKWGGTEK